MNRRLLSCMCLAVTVAVLSMWHEQAWAAAPLNIPGATPDYFNTPNWANSPPLRKFVDTLPGLNAGAANNLGQYIPIAVPDTTTYPGTDYYELELGTYTEKMHSDLPATALRGYRQTNTTDATVSQFHYLGPIIVAQKDRPVRVKFTNKLAVGAAGNLPLPVDTTIMGSGEGPKPDTCMPLDYALNPAFNPLNPLDPANPKYIQSGGDCEKFTQNRATLHLHGGRTPWISDGTPHQWIAPAGETTSYPQGVSVVNVPDMWFDATGATITNTNYPGTNCPGSTTCSAAGATNNPGAGSQTFYWTNQQSARLMFYHDHAWGITRLNVYAGEAAGYLIQDPVEQALVNGGTVNGRTFTAGTIPATQVPLVIQDRTFVDGDPASPTYVRKTDPLWNWGTGALATTANAAGVFERTPQTGDLWYPHIYVPAENPYNPDLTGMNPMGRWFYGPWFYPATPVCGDPAAGNPQLPICITRGSVPNPYFDPLCDPFVVPGGFCQPPEMPGTPDLSWGAEAFMDTMLVNGTVYPTVTVNPQAYRFRILNAANDRFLNLQLYQADTTVPPGCPTCASDTEVKMVPALANPAFPTWPSDAREGGVPDPTLRGPAWIQVGTEGGLLPAPVVLLNKPVSYNLDPTTFDYGNVNGGTLILGPAERADVIVDFSNYAGKTLIVYNDAPTAFPALVPQYNYYTGDPDRTGMGGAATTPVGFGPNIRTVMQIKVSGAGGAAIPDDFNATTFTTLQNAFKSTTGVPGAFALGQEPVIVGQRSYNSTYNMLFPGTWPNWGISRITDTAISFERPDGTFASNIAMIPKAMHDEMGGSFDEYGRMAAKLGLENLNPNANTANFTLQNYVDPPTDFTGPGDVQIWKITHNGVDTHPIHFHLFDVQLLNRVAWDGIIRMPDANELGWKDTVRINPLQDTIVAVRSILPVVPFPLPDSIRPLNPAVAIGSAMGFSQNNPAGAALVGIGMTNQLYNFGNEYVWHCHILAHEENDMMRAISFTVPPLAPSNLVAAVNGANVDLTFTDNSANETAFAIETSTDPTFPNTLVAPTTNLTPIVSVTSKTYGTTITATDTAPVAGAFYRVRAVDEYNNNAPVTPAIPVGYAGRVAANTYSPYSNVATASIIPIAIVTPMTLAFGNQPINTTSASQTVTLTNGGAANLVIDPLAPIALTGVNAADYAITTTCVSPVLPLASCTIGVTFTPTVAALRTASLIIPSNAPITPVVTVPITGTGTSAPIAGVAPASLNFGNQVVTVTSLPLTATLSNTGNAALPITSIGLTGVNAADFALLPNTCGTSLAAGANCAIAVTSTPAAAGARAATLAIVTGDPVNPTLNVPLSANGIAAAVFAAPVSLAFGNQALNVTSAAQTVTFTNSGTSVLNITAIALGGLNPADYALPTNTCGATLAPAASCSVGVTFTPLLVTALPASLTFTSNDPINPVLTVPLTGTGTAIPIAGVAPASLAFAAQLVNTLSAAQTVTLSNTGNAVLTIAGIGFAGANSADFTQTNNCVSPLAIGGTCTINVVSAPLTVGAKVASLAIASNDPVNPTLNVALTGTGIAPFAVAAPTSVTFAGQFVKTTSTASVVTLSNPGSAPLSLTGFAFTGVNAADYAQTNTCGTSLAVGASCSISITFTPLNIGTRAASLAISNSDPLNPTLNVPVSGTGLAPVGSISPATLAFGNILVNTVSPAQTVTLSNASTTTALDLPSIAFTGANAVDFTQTTTCGTSLLPGASCTIAVTFQPLSAGAKTASLTVTSNDPLNGNPIGTFSVPLTGLGSTITLSSQALVFGPQVVNTISGSQSMSILNTSASSMTISGITLIGTNPLDFTQTNNCPGILAGGSSCRITVRFAPKAVGIRTALLNIVDSAAGSPQTVPLTGTGVLGPAASIAPTSINFGTVRRGTTSPAQTITMSSTGGAPLLISRIRLTGGNTGDFTLVNNNCPIGGTGLAAGTTCTVSVAFKPLTRTGNRTTTVEFTDNANNVVGTRQTATLAGIAQ